MKETDFLYFHISLFACFHNTRSPASDENPLHSDTCDRDANNQICGKYRETGSFTSYYISSAMDNNNTARMVLIKPKFSAFINIFLAALFIIVEKPITKKFRGGHAEQADTLEFSSCASIASTRRPLFECAERRSLGRRVDNRRRSARSTKFHSVSAVLYDRPGTSDLYWVL